MSIRTLNELALLDHTTARQWLSLLRKHYPDWDFQALEASALDAVRDFCAFSETGLCTWNLTEFVGQIRTNLGLSDLTRIFTTLRMALRDRMKAFEGAEILAHMQQLDAWVLAVISRFEDMHEPQAIEPIPQIVVLSQCVAALNASLDLVSAYHAAAQLAHQLTGADLCAVYQIDGHRLLLRSSSGDLQPPRDVVEVFPTAPLETYVIDNCEYDLPIDFMRRQLNLPELQALCWVPLHAGSVDIGRLLIAYSHPKCFTHQDLRLKEIFAGHAGQAIYNAELYERLSELTVSQERQRIACELHDTMLQTLVSLNINLRVLHSFARHQAWEQMEPLIDTIRQLGKNAMQEGRDTLYSLRDEQICACSGQGLIELLQPQIDVFQEQSGITPQVNIHDPIPCIPTAIGHQLRRMVGEALMNIHRHALAHSVQLGLWNNGRELRIEIHDDGIGFNPGRVNYQKSFGLSGMRERSRLIDAKLSVDSTPGKGTRVTIRWPLMQAEPCTTCHAAADLRKCAE